jgi:nucleoside-diphosphate-sugar epimerase
MGTTATGTTATAGAKAAAGPGTGARSALILGGTGFIGRHVVQAFQQAGWDVAVAARRPGPVAAQAGARSLAVDLSAIAPAELARRLTAELPDVVVNAAGGVWNATEQDMIASNVHATERLLEALGRCPIGPRLVQLGTVMEYGPTEVGVSVSENSPPSPLGAYGRTKLAATQAVLAAAAAGQVDATVLRVANVSGPGSPRASLLGQVADSLAAAVRSGRPAVVELSPLRACRDYVDVRDVADAVLAAATAQAVGQVINIGRGEAVPVRALVELLITVSGVPARVVERVKQPGQPSSTAAGVDWLRVDITAARERLGWQATRTMRDSLSAHWAGIDPR